LVSFLLALDEEERKRCHGWHIFLPFFLMGEEQEEKKNEREKFSRHLMCLDIPSKKIQHAAKEHRLERDNFFCKRNALFCVTGWR
jgi:hypothetical protein